MLKIDNIEIEKFINNTCNWVAHEYITKGNTEFCYEPSIGMQHLIADESIKKRIKDKIEGKLALKSIVWNIKINSTHLRGGLRIKLLI